MSEVLRDQAEGLRRLLGGERSRVVTVISGKDGVGKTSILVNLAVALAKRGKYVMLIDEHSGASCAGHMLGLEPRYDLLHVMRGEKQLNEVILQGPEGVEIVPAAKGVRALAGLNASAQQTLVHAFSGLSHPVDVVLVDAFSGIAADTLSLSLAAQEVVIVVSSQPASITDAYALIKVLSQNYAKQRFRILVNKVASAAEAQSIYNNIEQVAGRFLDVALDFMGYVPLDGKLRQAARLYRPVVSAFPAAASAQALRQLAEVMEQWPYPQEEEGRLDVFMQRLIHNSRIPAQSLESYSSHV